MSAPTTRKMPTSSGQTQNEIAEEALLEEELVLPFDRLWAPEIWR